MVRDQELPDGDLSPQFLEAPLPADLQQQERSAGGHAHWVLGEPGWEDVAGFVADWLER
ncbi:MAG: hypothetical protein P8Z49_04885 [Acidobacteriota bacterium]